MAFENACVCLRPSMECILPWTGNQEIDGICNGEDNGGSSGAMDSMAPCLTDSATNKVIPQTLNQPNGQTAKTELGTGGGEPPGGGKISCC